MFAPSGLIYLIGGVPVDNTYQHTIDFSSQSEQLSYFQGKSVHTLTEYTFLRKDATIKVALPFESLWNVNYLLTRNTSGKWIFYFITDKQYVNDATTALMIETDVMQTYMWDYTLKECYVEREHVSDDTIGLHTVNENLDIGETITISKHDAGSIEDLTYVLITSVDENLQQVQGDIYTGVFSGLRYYASDDIGYLTGVIDALDTGGKSDALIAIFTMPKSLIQTVSESDRQVVGTDSSYFQLDGVDKNYVSIDGYVPENNKLFVYPYNYLEVNNNQGQERIYKYELFDSPSSPTQFFMTCNIAPNPIVYMTPYDYKGIYRNTAESMSIGDYPLCAWSSDVYANWLAQNQVSNAVRIGGSVLSLAGGLVTMNPLAIGAGALGVASSIGAFAEQSVKPPQNKGQTSGGSNIARGSHTFTFMKKTIRSEYARMIDDYFTRYGYKVNELKVPNVKSRPKWNYIKCHESSLTGDIDMVDLTKIKTVFNNGVTLWHYYSSFTPLSYSGTNK